MPYADAKYPPDRQRIEAAPQSRRGHMTLRELQDRILAVCPDAMFDEDGYGQVMVYTGLLTHPDEDWMVGDMPVRPFDD